MYKLIVSDLDDTLVPMNSAEIPGRTKRAVQCAMDMGYLFTVATGRIYPTARTCIDELGINLPVIAAGGSDIRLDHETIESFPLPDDAVADAVRLAKKLYLTKYLFCRDEVLTVPRDRNDKLFAEWTKGAAGVSPVRYLDDEEALIEAARGRTDKVLMWAELEDDHKEAMRAFGSFSDAVDVACGEKLNIELTRRGINKGTALRRIVEMLGLDLSEVVAIGDSGNDVAMLEAAGLGVAVENAMAEATEAADVVTYSCGRGGVGKAIEDLILPQGRLLF
ncbi:MAG: HAD family phosphatase [Clostridia bacterium]|nr:HAD family phosphatase [Clostridia bacterium]